MIGIYLYMFNTGSSKPLRKIAVLQATNSENSSIEYDRLFPAVKRIMENVMVTLSVNTLDEMGNVVQKDKNITFNDLDTWFYIDSFEGFVSFKDFGNGVKAAVCLVDVV